MEKYCTLSSYPSYYFMLLVLSIALLSLGSPQITNVSIEQFDAVFHMKLRLHHQVQNSQVHGFKSLSQYFCLDCISMICQFCAVNPLLSLSHAPSRKPFEST